MLSDASRRFAALPTAAKFLLILTAVLLPIGAGLVWAASQGIEVSPRGRISSEVLEQYRAAGN